MVVNSGVEVNFMILCKFDYLFVYWVIFLNVVDLLDSGVNIYIY